eukprot:TRINITY_DN3908_c0_g1_i1.p1 TRINITY_DN3908_c0_g1~~TRINITY_DN3908_c0_g1_i1.p1  ORF type:complete len:362 (+),score=168.04 TRINITY_DN3908_c0_g1_i1:35-1087(+)
MKSFFVLATIAALLVAAAPHTVHGAHEVLLQRLNPTFNQAIGIDWLSTTNEVVVSVNYHGGQPHNFEIIHQDGSASKFSDVAGLTEEVKITTVKPNQLAGGFKAGDMFVGSGADGVIKRITDHGATIETFCNTHDTYLTETMGLFRGSLVVDHTGLFGYKLVAVTTNGKVLVIDKDGVPDRIASVNNHLEGVAVLPNDPDRYGPMAGSIIAGNENNDRVYSIKPDGTVLHFNIGFAVEDIDVVPTPAANWYGVQFAKQKIVGIAADQWVGREGDILINQEFPDANTIGLAFLNWDGTSYSVEHITLKAGSDTDLGQWEHMTFARAGIDIIEPDGDQQCDAQHSGTTQQLL